MAAVSATYDGHRDNGYHDRKIPPPRIGLDDTASLLSESKWRCDTLCMPRGPTGEAFTPLASLVQSGYLDPRRDKIDKDRHFLEYTLLDSESTCEAPPSYLDSTSDTPPAYAEVDLRTLLGDVYCLTTSECNKAQQLIQPNPRPELVRPKDPILPMTTPSINFDDFSNVREAKGGKKAKAQKQSSKNDWEASGDEGNKDGGAGEENGGGGDGGSNGAGGPGGDGGGDGGGDDWNDWNASNNNKKKKGKKNKGGVDDDEEKKKKKEEDEKKETAEEDAANGGSLSWANGGDTNQDDEWGGFTAGKKGKKGKKEKALDPTPDPAANNPLTGTFDDINLGDSPKLDFSFGDTGTKATGGSFGLGGWGSGWGTTTSKWDFNAADTGSTDITDKPKDTKDSLSEGGDSSIWSFGSNKKNKKKTTTTSAGFDFGLGTLDENKVDETTKTAETDDWGTFAPAGGKAKKDKKKSAFEDIGAEHDISGLGTAPEERTTTADDSWSAWGTASTKKDKKKGKKGDEEVSTVPPPPLAAPVDTPVEDDWGGFGSKKTKKKGKTAITEEHLEEPLVAAGSKAEPAPEADDGWGSFNTKKDKKKGKKTQAEEQDQVTAGIETAGKEPDAASQFGWGDFDSSKKGKKKGNTPTFGAQIPESFVEKGLDPEPDLSFDFGGKKGKKKGNTATFGEQIPESLVEKEPDPEPDLSFDFGGKKGKKSKKGVAEDPPKESAAAVMAEIEPVVDDGWGAFGSKKDKSKSKKGVIKDPARTDDANIMQVPESDPLDDFGWGTTKKEKKEKKDLISEVQDDPNVVVAPGAAAETSVLDGDWVNGWGSTDKKNKKGKKAGAADSKKVDTAPPPPPPAPVEPEPSVLDSWGTTNKVKKGKKGKAAEPDPLIVAVPDPPEDKVDTFEEEFGGWGLSAKDRKKKEKEREKEREREKIVEEEREREEQEQREKEEQEQKEKEEREQAEKDRTKNKTKTGKKGKVTTENPKIKDLVADSVPDTMPAAVEEDSWGIWGSSGKKDKTRGGKSAMPEIPPPVPTPPAQGLTPEPELIAGLDDVDDGGWGSFAPAKNKGKKDIKTKSKSTKAEDAKATNKTSKDKAENVFADIYRDNSKTKDVPEEESAANAAKSFWGGVGSTSTAKWKTSKDKDKEADKAKELLDLDDFLDDEMIGIAEEPVPTFSKKGSKTKGDSKLGKAGSKDSAKKKNSDEALLDDLLEMGEDQLAGAMEEAEGKDDAWSFWGSKKTGGKKADEPPNEITKPAMTNQKGSLKNNLKKEKEKEADGATDEASQSQPSKASKSTMSTSKPTAKSAVLQRVKDLEKEKGSGKAKEKNSVATPEPQPPAPEIEPLFASKAESATPNPKKSSATPSKSKAGKNDSKNKGPSPPFTQPKDTSTVPGSFPGESPEDDLLDLLDPPPEEKKTAKKSAKSKREPKQEPKQDSMMDMMDEFNFDAPAPEAPPTPPAEPVSTKPAKKERARVVKNEGASSWGFWGAAPKKDTKKDVPSKDDAELPPKPKEKKPAPGLGRSKSTKTVKEKDKEVEKSSKSSGSDEKEKKSESRPSKSRGSSFGGFFGGPPPVRAKAVRRNSTAASKTASSRRQSMDIDAIGLPSPPAEDAPEMSSKAAKLMGTAKLDRKPSTRGKQKAKVIPDPYAIDDDDMVMVGGLDEPVLDDIAPQEPPIKAKKDKPSKSKPKKETKTSPEVMDDVVMVEAGSPQDEIDGGPRETLAFDERPRPQRANTSAKKLKSGGVMGGLFGFGKSRRASETFERPRSKGVLTDDEGLSRRKRTVAGGDDSAKRLRRDDRQVRRSDREDRAGEGYVYDVAAEGGIATEAEDAEARKERKAKRAAARETESREAGDRRARRHETERTIDDARKLKSKEARDRRARKEEEAEAIRLEEKRARRAARADMNAKLATDEPVTRPAKSDRHRSYMDQPMASGANDDVERHARREARRAARTPGEKSSRKKTTAPVDDYFDQRNGAGGQEPYLHGANDHTSSWVKSQISDPAPPPPVEGTVIEPTPVFGGTDNAVLEDDAARRAKRKSRRQSRYVEMTPEEEEARRRRKDREIRSSEGSREDDGGRPYASRRKSDYVGGMKSFDARPSLAAGGKRGSWLKRVSGF